MKTAVASGPILWYMTLMGFDGWASLWRKAYFRPGCENDKGLIAHELQHLEQMRRDGKLTYMVKYLYWMLLKGAGNPYEVEARKAQLEASYK